MVNSGHAERAISVSRFKAECLGLFEEIAAGGDTVLVTKRGRPIARVVPVAQPAPLHQTVKQLVDDDELIAPVGGTWDAER